MSVVPMRSKAPPRPVIEYLNFANVKQNPKRDLEGNPLTDAQIDRLVLSIESTGFWDHLSVRPHPTEPGHYQLASGHARVAAAQRAGLTGANFIVGDYDDTQMARMMVNENVTQFGKDSFKTYKEAAIVAADIIMRDVIGDPKRGAKYITSNEDDPEAATKLANAILAGGCPGRKTIGSFYSPTGDWKNSTLDSNNIELALTAFRETGALAAWHAANNPKLQHKAPPATPTIDPEALKPFDKPAHVRSFIKAVAETGTPFELQRAVSDRVVKKLGAEPPKLRSGRDTYQGHRPDNERFNATNIRSEVVKESLERNRSPKRKAELERIEQMTSLEKGLMDLDAGLTRTLTGFQRITKILELMGSVTDADITVTAKHHLGHIAASMAQLQAFIAKQPMRKFLAIKGEK